MCRTVLAERLAQQIERVAFAKVRSAIILRQLGASALHDYAVPSLVEHLGHAGQHGRAVESVVEADSDEACGELARIAWKAPRPATGLVVDRRVKIPSAGRIVLQSSCGLCALRLPSSRWVGRTRKHKLDRRQV